MNKQLKIGILVFIGILFISIILFLFLNNKDREDKAITNIQNAEENENQEGGNVMEDKTIKLFINDHELTATLNENTSSIALINMLKKGSITIHMSDYANMEKVGDLGVELPSNDENITTSAGDLILYQGKSFVIYYDTNRWNLTRLGKIDNINGQELKKILGNGDVTVKLSLN